jgi:hypothetical protein
MPYILVPAETRFWKMVDKTTSGCWLWRGAKNYGRYGRFYDGTKLVYAHIYSFLLAGNILLPGNYVLHTCDKPVCVNPAHLFQGTQKDNVQDCKQKQINNFGAKNGQAKLTEKQVKEIIIKLSLHSDNALATQYNVSRTRIYAIRRNRNWQHLPR